MTANKPGALNQKPLYGCTSCFEDYSWPAEDLRVHDSECWCGQCWEESRWEFPDRPSWSDLEPYTPALQAEREKLRALLLQSAPIVHAHAGASHMLEGFRPRRNKWDALVEQIDAAIAKTTGEKDE